MRPVGFENLFIYLFIYLIHDIVYPYTYNSRMENSRLLDVLPEIPLDLRSRGVSGQHVSYNREFSIL
jgi:hypothetical protein